MADHRNRATTIVALKVAKLLANGHGDSQEWVERKALALEVVGALEDAKLLIESERTIEGYVIGSSWKYNNHYYRITGITPGGNIIMVAERHQTEILVRPENMDEFTEVVEYPETYVVGGLASRKPRKP